jgi:hypothetical protein
MPFALRSCRLLATLTLLLALDGATRAADEVGVFFDGSAASRTGFVAPFAVQPVYVTLLAPSQNPSSFELSVELPADWTVISVHHGPPGCLQIPPQDPFDLEAGLCTDCEAATPAQLGLMRIELGWFSALPVPTNAEICLGPYSMSNFDPPTPGYRSCSETLVPLAYVPEFEICELAPPIPGNCAVINPDVDCGLPAQAHSWSALKATY